MMLLQYVFHIDVESVEIKRVYRVILFLPATVVASPRILRNVARERKQRW